MLGCALKNVSRSLPMIVRSVRLDCIRLLPEKHYDGHLLLSNAPFPSYFHHQHLRAGHFYKRFRLIREEFVKRLTHAVRRDIVMRDDDASPRHARIKEL